MKHETESRVPKGNAAYINRLNKIEVLGLIRDHVTISRAEIVEMSGLSAPTVSRIVKDLPIIPVAFGDNAALMGAFALILERVMDLSLTQ